MNMSDNKLEERVAAREILSANLLRLMPLGDLQNLHLAIRNQAPERDESLMAAGIEQINRNN